MFGQMCPSHCLPVVLLCISKDCSERLLCLRCADSHIRHELVSLPHFQEKVLPGLQTNRDNPERMVIAKALNTAKEEMLSVVSHLSLEADHCSQQGQHRAQPLRGQSRGLLRKTAPLPRRRTPPASAGPPPAPLHFPHHQRSPAAAGGGPPADPRQPRRHRGHDSRAHGALPAEGERV
jgi:hypothetical protein